jgi:hypothetical protein
LSDLPAGTPVLLASGHAASVGAGCVTGGAVVEGGGVVDVVTTAKTAVATMVAPPLVIVFAFTENSPGWTVWVPAGSATVLAPAGLVMTSVADSETSTN